MAEKNHNQINGRPVVYNIGYQFLSPEKLVERIREYGVTVLVDVRSVPFSRLSASFNRDKLAELVPCKYIWRGKTLGGKKGTGVAEWTAGLKEIAEIAKTENVLLMCLEDDVKKCHRRQLAELLAEHYKVHSINL